MSSLQQNMILCRFLCLLLLHNLFLTILFLFSTECSFLKLSSLLSLPFYPQDLLLCHYLQCCLEEGKRWSRRKLFFHMECLHSLAESFVQRGQVFSWVLLWFCCTTDGGVSSGSALIIPVEYCWSREGVAIFDRFKVGVTIRVLDTNNL